MRTQIVRRLAPTALAAALLLPVGPAPVAAQNGSGGPPGPEAWAGMRYRMVGPTRGGRVTAVAGHRARPSTFYMGATGGGVWKTDDWGVTWNNVSDGFIHTGSIGALTVAPSDPDVVWLGTGSDGIRSNVIVGSGVYRSDDAGATWRRLGLEDAGQMGAVVVHPDDPDVAWVAALGNPFGRNAQRGVFKTDDGGASWRKVLFTSDSVGAVDLEMHPTDPSILYASMWRGERKPWTIISGMREDAREDGIWRSTDGGETWRYVPLGLPSGLIGKIDFAVTPADPDRVYALVETKEPDEGLYRSDDAGVTWRLVSNHEPLMDRPFYYTNVDADPVNPDLVYVNATQFWRSLDAGATWDRRSTPHGDNHDMWINPDDPRIFVQSNDGGANVTRDGGETWSTQMNQPTAELYQVDVDDQFPYWLYAGQQDNTTLMVPSAPPAEASVIGPAGWLKDVGGCETGPAVPRPGDPTVVYSNCKGRFGRYSHRTGQEQQYYVGAVNLYGTNPAELPYRFQRVVPIEVSPHDPDVVYHGSQFVHRTTDGGRTWERISPDLTAFRPERQMASGGPITRDITGEEHYSTLYVIEASPHDPAVIWAGANDGPVHVTRDGGASWDDVTPPMPPEGRIRHIDISPHDPAKAYVAAYRTLLGDFHPQIWRTSDFGRSWTHLTPGDNGIPADEPTRVVREDRDVPGLLYAGTDRGMYVSFDDGARWQPIRMNFPVTPVTDIEVVDDDLAISTMGRSFWILDELGPLRQAQEAMAAGGPWLYRPEDAHRVRAGGFFGFGPVDPNTPQYAPAGVTLDYWLPAAARSVRLEIVDGSGRIARTYDSEGGGVVVTQRQEMRAPVSRRSGRPRLGTARGQHRIVWDLEYDVEGGRAPMAVPGRYTARLTVDGVTRERPFRVLIDPRVAEDGVTVADLQAQFDLHMEVAGTLRDARETVASVEATLERARAAGDAGAVEGLEAIHEELVTAEAGSYPQPMLVDQLGYLLGMISRADQPPGRDAYERHADLQARLEALKERLREVSRTMAE